ncbi:MAG TPA: PDZ domain-containing protein [Planctomycetota bacterium]|nr:PDZ domain-containing protein [Planctomycetota bacterium]
MKRLLTLICLLAVACDSKNPPPAAPVVTKVQPGPVELPKTAGGDAALLQAEQARSAALYEQAVAAFTTTLEADPKDAAAHEGRALARWRLSLMRGTSDPDVDKDLEAAGDRPRGKALKALARLVDGARARGGWEPLAPRILKEVFAKAFPDSAAFTADWTAIVRPPDGETQAICEALASAPEWPLAAGVRAALEGRDVPAPGQEGLLWILSALRLPPSEAMKSLESATTPDQGILFQAQAQLLAAEGKFTEAVGRMTAAPMPLLRAAANVAAGKSAPALESLAANDLSPFARAIKAAAVLQSGAEDALQTLETPVPWLKFERGLRRLAAGNRTGALEDLRETAPLGGAFSTAWLGFALWHAQDYDGAEKELARAAEMSPDKELAGAIEETRGYALQAKGEEEAGAERLVSAAAKNPSRDVFFRLSKHLRPNRQWKALQDLAAAVARSLPSEPEVWAARAEASFWLKNYDAAVQTVTFATDQKIDPKRLLRWRALAFEEQGKWEEAQDDWSRLTDVADQEGNAFAHRAWMRAKLGRWSQAKEDAEKGVSQGADAWGVALARFALAAESLLGPPGEGEESDPETRKEAALAHLRAAAKTGAVEPSDLEKIREMFKPIAADEWKKIVDSSSEKQKELKDEAKKGAMLGVMLDHGSGVVAVIGTYRRSGARAAGFAPEDVILEVDGRRVNHISDVGSSLAGREPGQQVTVKVRRELRPKLRLVEVRTITLTHRAVFED